MTFHGRAAAMVVGLLLSAPFGVANAEDAVTAIWVQRADGTRFRVAFDPGQRLILGTGVAWRGGDFAGQGVLPAIEVGLLLRSERPAAGWDVSWKRNHEIGRLRLQPGSGIGVDGTAVSGVLYRGLYLRQSREGTLTLPTAPPIALPLPFDVGLLAEVGYLDGAVWPAAGGRGLTAGVVHGEVLADFWRSPRAGRWLAVGIGGRYEVGLGRDAGGALAEDHRVTPMTALSVALHAERADGLLSGGVRVEGAHRWSSHRGWEQAFRADADVEVVPIAVNDRPLSLFAMAGAMAGPELANPDLRLLIGIRFAEPL